MDESNILLPVICHTCGQPSMAEFPSLVVITALFRWNRMALYASCHEGSWDASDQEIGRLRDYVAEHYAALIDQLGGLERGSGSGI